MVSDKSRSGGYRPERWIPSCLHCTARPRPSSRGARFFLALHRPRASGNGLLTQPPFICYDGFVGRKVLQGKSPRLLRTRGTARQFFKLRGPSRALPSLRFPSATCCTEAEVVQMTNIELLAFLISIAGLMLSAYALGRSNRRSIKNRLAVSTCWRFSGK